MSKLQRLILNFPGFETTTAVHQLERLSAGGKKTAALWGFELERGEIEEDNVSHKTTCEYQSKSKNWEASSRFVQFSWSDIISKYENRPYPYNLVLYLPKFLMFFLDGTVFKYAKTSGRYFGFTIYPILMMIGFAWFSCFVMGMVGDWLSLGSIVKFIGWLALFLGLCKWPGDLAYLNLSINDWGFARDMVNRSNPQIEERYQIFANHLIEEIVASKHDEIIFVGHSFGSVWAIASLNLALEKKPDLLDGKRVSFLALGSSLLKITLVKKAKFFVEWVKKVLSVEHMVWHEIQTKTDIISFYKSDPFEPLGINDPECTVVYSKVNFKDGLSKTRHRKMKKSFYLAHRQYILYLDKRVYFDFQLRCFGPFFCDDLAKDPSLIESSKLIEPIKG